jgi:hypothetical protein
VCSIGCSELVLEVWWGGSGAAAVFVFEVAEERGRLPVRARQLASGVTYAVASENQSSILVE